MPELTDLTSEECWPLLDGAEFGRIGWNAPDGPIVLPVNYALDGDSVWIRTRAHSDLARQVDESKIALLVDDIDPSTHVGWTVLLRGIAHAEYHEERVPDAVRELETWAEGARPIWLQLKPDHVTGRRLS